jgi:hypothetical protein
VFSDKEKSKILNKYLSSISNIDDTSHNLPDSYSLCNGSLSDIVIGEQEVIDIIATLPVNKAIGPDCISHKMLKSTVHTIFRPLCMLFDKSLREKSLPSYWKEDHVLPLFKKDDPSLPCNYRPVSLLSCVSKVMERIIFKHVYIFSTKITYFTDIRLVFYPVNLQYSNYWKNIIVL